MKPIFFAVLAVLFGCSLFQPASAADGVTYKERVLHAFRSGADGASPIASVIVANSMLYGTTYVGGGTGCGGAGCGTIFSIDPDTGAEKVLYAFKGGIDGALPWGSLIAVNGLLYGTTYQGGLTGCGGDYGCGTIFSIDPNTGAEKVLYTFCSQQFCPDGALPATSLIQVKGKLYGTTIYGGHYADAGTYGTVFAFDLKTGFETVVYTFCSQVGQLHQEARGAPQCTDAWGPLAGLIEVKGSLYGTTASGARNGYGAAFEVDLNTGAETVLYSFGSQPNAKDGTYPFAGLIDDKGTLYGTTGSGGAYYPCINGDSGCGTVFSIDPNTGSENVLHSFSCQQTCTDGAGPEASLIDVKGTLFGTTGGGGGTGCNNGFGCGIVFSIDRNTGAENILYSFCSRSGCKDGAYPEASLIAVNGKLYGTTAAGGRAGCGSNGCGTVFVIEQKH